MSKYLVLLITIIGLTFNCYSQTTYKIGQQTLSLNDSNRQRKLITEIWYPTEIEIKKSESNASSISNELKAIRDGKIIKKRCR